MKIVEEKQGGTKFVGSCGLKKRIDRLERGRATDCFKFILKFSDGTKQTVINDGVLRIAVELLGETKRVEEIICFSDSKESERYLSFPLAIMGGSQEVKVGIKRDGI